MDRLTALWTKYFSSINAIIRASLGLGIVALFILYYIVAITVLIMHFTGVLARYNLEWLVLVLAVTVFPAVIYL